MSDSTAFASQGEEDQRSLLSSVTSFFSSVLPGVQAEEEEKDSGDAEGAKDEGSDGEGDAGEEAEEEEEEEDEPEDVSFARACSERSSDTFLIEPDPVLCFIYQL
jgi:hypothetical protein